MRNHFFQLPFIAIFYAGLFLLWKKVYNAPFPKNYKLFMFRPLLGDASFYCDIYISCNL